MEMVRVRLLPFRCSSENEKYDSDLVHLPPGDESSLINLLVEQFIKAMSNLNNNSSSSSSSSSATNGIKHWAHDEHHLQLMNELIEEKDNDETLLLCDGCAKPIQTDGDLFYGCVPCKYFLHKVCAELPKEIEHHLFSGTLFADKFSERYKLFWCRVCNAPCNGIFFRFISKGGYISRLHIECAMLPKMIKHEAHRHQLNQVYGTSRACKACGQTNDGCKHRCKECDFYVCDGCIMKARRVKHPWDPHPLHLINEAGMVVDHEHEFNCEFCSEDIDTNFWFYHCSECDLSFHLYRCFERSRYGDYSNVKFGATDIIIDKVHHHSLTFVLNKKLLSCKECGRKLIVEPVLECAPCKALFCIGCCVGVELGSRDSSVARNAVARIIAHSIDRILHPIHRDS